MFALQLLGPGLGDLVRDAVPGWLVPFFLAVTRLGNVALLLTLFALDYWFRDDRRGAHAIALAIGAVGLITALKTYFDAPRPPPETTVVPIGGYSFPSGHATTATIGWGLLAYDSKLGPRWARYGLAGVIVVLVALSRVVLGVHFVRDVVAGVAFGLVFLVVAVEATGHDPRRGFLLASGLAVVAFVVSGATHKGVTVLGWAAGGSLAWWWLDGVSPVESLRERVLVLAVALPVLLGIGYVSIQRLALPLVFVVNATLIAGILWSPRLVGPFAGSDPRRRGADSEG